MVTGLDSWLTGLGLKLDFLGFNVYLGKTLYSSSKYFSLPWAVEKLLGLTSIGPHIIL